MTGNRTTKVTALAAALAFCLLVLMSSGVAAHAVLSDTQPSEGGHVDEVPETVTLEYTGDGVDEVIDLQVKGPDGDDVVGEVRRPGDVSREVFVDIEDGGEGVYVVEWEVLATDGHVTRGTWFFYVGDEALSPEAVLEAYEPETPSEVAYLQVLPSALIYVTLVLLAGVSAAMAYAVEPVTERYDVSVDEVSDTVERVLLSAAAVAVAGAALLFLDFVRPSGSSVDGVLTLSSHTGGVMAAQLLVAAALTVGFFVGRRRGLQLSYMLYGGFAGGVALALAVGLTSHSASHYDLALGTLTTAVHLLAVSIWAGGLTVLVYLLPRLQIHLEADAERRLVADVIHRFSVLALMGVTVFLASGLVMTSWLVPDVDALLSTLHGQVLTGKIALVLTALTAGGFARFVLLRRIDPGTDDLSLAVVGTGLLGGSSEFDPGDLIWFRRAVHLELAVVVVVLLASGLVAASVPGTVSSDDAAAEMTEVELGVGEDVDASLEIQPVSGYSDGETVVLREDTPAVATLHPPSSEAGLEGESVFLEHRETGTSMNPSLEPLEDRDAYGVVLTLPETGEWMLRLNIWTGEEFLSDEMKLVNEPWDGDHGSEGNDGNEPQDEHDHHEEDGQEEMEHDHGGHGHEDGGGDGFSTALISIALLILVLGATAVTFQVGSTSDVRHGGDL